MANFQADVDGKIRGVFNTPEVHTFCRTIKILEPGLF